MSRGLSRVIVLIALLVCALLACKRKESDGSSSSLSARASKLKPDAKKRLEQLAALDPKVKAEAAVTTDRPVVSTLSRKSVAIIGDRYLTDPNRTATKDELHFENGLLGLCKYGTEQEPQKEDDIKYLEECVALKIVAVIRPRSVKLPKIKMKSETYDSGELKADVLVYDLETANLIGAYDILVSNDPELKLPGKDQSEDDWMGIAVADLETNAETKVEQKLGIAL